MFAIIMRMAEPDSAPLIVAFIADLIFQSKIELAAEHLGYQMIWVENEGQLTQTASQTIKSSARSLGEHLEGTGAKLIDQLSRWQPVLIIFDLGNVSIPWREWIALIKSAPETRRIPVICYGPHIDRQLLEDARSAGAELVTARSNFSVNLTSLIDTTARQTDSSGIESACQGALSAAALRGLELFNQGEYFDAHEFLEEAWRADPTSARDLYQAIIQVAVAYLQIERRNYPGAVKMFWRLRQWINPLPAVCRGVNVAKLREDSTLVYQAVIELGYERIAEFDTRLFRPVEYQS